MCSGLGFEAKLGGVGGELVLGVRSGHPDAFDFADRQILERHRLLRQCVDESRGDEDDFVHFALDEQVARHRRDRPGLRESRRVAVRKIGDELRGACARRTARPCDRR